MKDQAKEKFAEFAMGHMKHIAPHHYQDVKDLCVNYYENRSKLRQESQHNRSLKQEQAFITKHSSNIAKHSSNSNKPQEKNPIS